MSRARTPRSALVVLGLLLAGASLSHPAEGQLRRGRSRGAQPASGLSSVTRVTEVSIDDLPRGTLPAVFDETKRPESAPEGPDVTDLKVIPSSPQDFARWKARRGDEWLGVRLEPAVGAYGVVAFTQNQNGYSSQRVVAANCNASQQQQYNTQLRAMRWERASVTDTGATFEIDDAWFDPRACRVASVRRAVLHPRALVTHNGSPVVYGVRTDDELTLFFPADAIVAVDTTTATPAPEGHGAFARVTVPLRKGMATTVLAEVQSAQLSAWQQAATGKTTAVDPQAPVPSGSLTIGIDIMQTVSDKSVTVLARTSTRVD